MRLIYKMPAINKVYVTFGLLYPNFRYYNKCYCDI